MTGCKSGRGRVNTLMETWQPKYRFQEQHKRCRGFRSAARVAMMIGVSHRDSWFRGYYTGTMVLAVPYGVPWHQQCHTGYHSTIPSRQQGSLVRENNETGEKTYAKKKKTNRKLKKIQEKCSDDEN